jgi:hypothetical protein
MFFDALCPSVNQLPMNSPTDKKLLMRVFMTDWFGS